MAEIVRMPKLSDTMTEGVVAEWHKKIGDSVESGELLAEIETDKATMEFESFQDGVLLHIGVEKGKAAPVDSILAILGEKGEDIQALLDEEAKNNSKEETVPEAKEEKTPEVKTEKQEAVTPAKKIEATVSKPQQVSVSSNGSDKRLKASPLAKRLAEEKGINLNFVQGSGDEGRITKRDIENYSGGAAPAFSAVESYSEETVSQMRKTIAKRLAESKFSAPHFYLTISIDMDKVIEARKSINDLENVKVSFNDFVIKAAAVALKKHPKVNSSWLGDTIRYNNHVHVGVAVAVPDGLLVPVVRFADGKTLSQVSSEVRDYAQRAKDKKLQPEDWEGNTFTISNLGMFGIEEFTAIINPPDSCIMAVGGISQVPVVKNGAVVPGNVMKVTLSCDHRVVDGATGSEFLQTFKKYLENPVLLLGMHAI
jgi:pyruvate dehydrogenase E2 component (dihydrolipoamide acetyltransferase)